MYDETDWACSRLKEITTYLSKSEFSITEINSLEPFIEQVQDTVDKLKNRISETISGVREAEWKVFIEHLPVVNTVSDESVIIDSKEYFFQGEIILHGNRSNVYHSKDDEIIYIFQNGHYYDESKWGNPALLNRDKMGFGGHTIYKKENGKIIAASSGTVNFVQMYNDLTENGMKDFGYDDPEILKEYENPIINL